VAAFVPGVPNEANDVTNAIVKRVRRSWRAQPIRDMRIAKHGGSKIIAFVSGSKSARSGRDGKLIGICLPPPSRCAAKWASGESPGARQYNRLRFFASNFREDLMAAAEPTETKATKPVGTTTIFTASRDSVLNRG
jgi:hypothetical protein